MKFTVVPIPTHLAEEFADLEINPIVMGYFPSKALEMMGWNETTILEMIVKPDGFWIKEVKENDPNELIYEMDEDS